MQNTLLERSPVESHATMGAMERANRTLVEILRTMKHAAETRVGGRLDTDHPLISWMVRHCCWIFCRYHVRADGRTPHEMLRNDSYRGGLACFEEVFWAWLPGTRLLRGKFEVNWFELVWLGENRELRRALGAATSTGVRKFRTVRRLPESASWRGENPSQTTTVSPNVNVDEMPEEKMQDPAWSNDALSALLERGSAYTALNAVDESMESCCSKAV